ncbi:hypothetical protein [Duganella sp. P38]|uniref:hypothetical protein n=1 Tax=Duganella sp. P38 TaxID=3423949 RepID=UPI003D78CAF4
MSKKISMRRLAWGLAAATLWVLLYEGYTPARAVPPQEQRCGEEGVRAQIRYDNGRTLVYCSVSAMFAQLGAQEQPGMVRAALVLDADGRWSDARHLPNYRQMLKTCARAACN